MALIRSTLFFALTLVLFSAFCANGGRRGFRPPKKPPQGHEWREWEGMPEAFEEEVLPTEWSAEEIPDWDSDEGGVSEWEEDMDDWFDEWLEFLRSLVEEENGGNEEDDGGNEEVDGGNNDELEDPDNLPDEEANKGLWLSLETIAIIGGVSVVVIAILFTAVCCYCMNKSNQTKVVELKKPSKTTTTKRQKAKTRVSPSSISGTTLPSAPPPYDSIVSGVNAGYQHAQPQSKNPLEEDPVYALLNTFTENPTHHKKKFKKPNPNY